jgi:hypothetical protein
MSHGPPGQQSGSATSDVQSPKLEQIRALVGPDHPYVRRSAAIGGNSLDVVASTATLCANLITVSRLTLCDNSHMETLSFDLQYLDADPSTDQPSACLYMKPSQREAYGGISADKLVSAPCLSFIELDAEIRRLHAELDELRGRARRRFYKAEAAAGGA